MFRRDEAHLAREREVEKEDTAVRAVTRLIVNITIGAHVPPGMSTVYLLELLIHNGGMRMATEESFRTDWVRESTNFFLIIY